MTLLPIASAFHSVGRCLRLFYSFPPRFLHDALKAPTGEESRRRVNLIAGIDRGRDLRDVRCASPKFSLCESTFHGFRLSPPFERESRVVKQSERNTMITKSARCRASFRKAFRTTDNRRYIHCRRFRAYLDRRDRVSDERISASCKGPRYPEGRRGCC